MFTLGVTGIWTLTGSHHGSTIPIVAFAVTGYSTVMLWRNMPARAVDAVIPNLSLMYHRNVKLIDVILARLLLEAMGSTASFIVLAILWTSIGFMKPPENILEVLFGWFMLGWFGLSLALLLGCLSYRSDLVHKIWHPTAYIFFPLSGAAFMVDYLPPAARPFILIIPMVHGVEILREGYFGSMVHAHYDLQYLTNVCIALTVFALAQERYVSKRIVLE